MIEVFTFDKQIEFCESMAVGGGPHDAYSHIAASLERLRELERELLEMPEDCKLTAHPTGDGWCLAVEHEKEGVLALLAWPAVFGETQTADQLRAKGFTIV